MAMRFAFAVAILCILFTSGPMIVAQPSPELQKRLLGLQGKPASSWTRADLEQMEQTMLALTREMLASGMTRARRARFERIHILASNDEKGPPAWADGDTIYLSRDALGELIILGMYLGHDLYVLHGGELPIPPSLLLTPYAARPVIPILPTLQELITGRVPQQLIRCPPNATLCAEPQYVAILLGTIGFVVAHEAGHVFLGHGQKLTHPAGEEVAADREAWRMLLAVAPKQASEEDESSVEARVRTEVIAAPFLILRWLRDSSREADVETLDERAERLRALAGDEYFGDPSSLVDPESRTGQLRNVQVEWSEDPDDIWIDGVRVAPSEITGHSLRLMTPAHIFARKNSRFGFAEIARTGGKAIDVARLEFVEPLAGASSSQEMGAMRRDRQWFRLFLATTSPSAQPRSPEVAFEFNQALNGLGLGAAIDPGNAALAARRGARALTRRWWIDAQPLGTWRANP
jgi:hypothetical protein